MDSELLALIQATAALEVGLDQDRTTTLAHNIAIEYSIPYLQSFVRDFGLEWPLRNLIVDGEFEDNFAMSARNINHVSLLPAKGLNVYDIMRSDKLVLTKAAVQAIEERLS